jgi:DNA replication regulator SLD2
MGFQAAKYKEYNKSRDILSGKPVQEPSLPPPKLPSHRQTPRKRKHEDKPQIQASKRLQLQIQKTPSRTPIKGSLQPWEVDPYESPSMIRNLFTPSKKAIGPTPQKDGVVLGLFDMLQEHGTPSSRNVTTAISQDSIQATPRKVTTEISLKHSRTPASAGKRYLLDSFATPAKNRILNGSGGKTPSSVSKLHFSTPSFLRRDSQRALQPLNENDEGGPELSPQMVRVPRKPLVRGLSSMLAGLRKLEEEAADEDLEALREMEAEESGLTKHLLKGVANEGGNSAPRLMPPEILVEDSQNGLLGGLDDEALLDSEPDEEQGRDGQPLKVYKKKGQKRTTRKVTMKPTRSKPQPVPEDGQNDLADQDADAVLETQIDYETTAAFGDVRNFDSDSQSEYTASEGGTRYRRPNQKKDKKANKDGKIKSAARKVSALANQNFKRLKLRNSGAKGGPAHNSRFRRKR